MIGESMKLDKKFTYDGTRIIKRNKEELYHFVYERIWDLTIYDHKLLESYRNIFSVTFLFYIYTQFSILNNFILILFLEVSNFKN